VTLVIVDTGVANLASVGYAFERLGAPAVITDDVETVRTAERVLIPGVGSAPFAMKSIESKGLKPVLQSLKQPTLGICLGMQLLFETLEEGDQVTEGLGLIRGTVGTLDTETLPSPHMGWNTLQTVSDDPLLDGVAAGDYAYFVHSYAVAADNPACLAKAAYGSEFSAIVRQDNVWGCQFHPERSSKTGAQILENFLKLTV